MSQEVAADRIEPSWVERSALYRDFMAERAELLKHKWLESEKAGHDIGRQTAQVSWALYHRAQWVKARRWVRDHGGNGD